MNFKDIKITEQAEKIIKLDNGEIKIKQFLPIADKYGLVMITAQGAREGLLYNPIKLDYLFNVNIVFMYTDIEFSDEDKAEPYKVYDALKECGLLNRILSEIPAEEYSELFEWLLDYTELEMQSGTSAGAVFKSFVQDLPKNAQMVQEIVNNFDKEKYQAVVDFAKAANGGRPI